MQPSVIHIAGTTAAGLQSLVADGRQAASQTDENAGLKRSSLAVGHVYALDVEPRIKARMLRELSAWYRAMAVRTANPIIWESRLLTAEDLADEANRIEQRTGSNGPAP